MKPPLSARGISGGEDATPLSATNHPRRPNFFIVGAEKCATTTLHTTLAAHPDVCMSEMKEPRFFDTDQEMRASWCIRDHDDYLRQFSHATTEKIIGEASPTYLASRVAASNIQKYSPGAKILISLRHPVDYIVSLHRQYLHSNNESIPSLEAALAAEEARGRNNNVPKHAHFPAGLLYTHRARFASHVTRFYEIFGTDRVLVILLDDLQDAPLQTLRRVLDFLDIDADIDLPLVHENRGADKRLRNLAVRRMLKDRPGIRRALGKLDPRFRQRLGNAVQMLVRDRSNAIPEIDPSLLNRMANDFRPEIESLEHLLQRDLTDWKYRYATDRARG